MISFFITPAGEIDFAEFVLVVANSRHNTKGRGLRLDGISELREMWAHFDADGDGSITVDEIAEVLVTLGSEPSKATRTAEDMMRVADKGGDGEIEFVEFVDIITAANAKEAKDAGQEEVLPEEDEERMPWEQLIPLLGDPRDFEPDEGIDMAEAGFNVDEEDDFETRKAKRQAQADKAFQALIQDDDKQQEEENDLTRLSPIQKRRMDIEAYRHECATEVIVGSNGWKKRMDAIAVLEKQQNEETAILVALLQEKLGVEIFQKMPRHAALELVSHITLERTKPGAVLALQGKPCMKWHFVLEGALSLSHPM